jgi:hypothetical protein
MFAAISRQRSAVAVSEDALGRCALRRRQAMLASATDG